MKLELDFSEKKITIKECVNAQDLYKKLKDLNLNLKEWELITDVQIVNTYPFYPYTTYLTDQEQNDLFTPICW